MSISEEDVEKALDMFYFSANDWRLPSNRAEKLREGMRQALEAVLLGMEEKAGKPVTDPYTQNNFDDFWKAYPEKKAKLAAQKAYKAARKRGVTHEAIMSGLTRYIKDKEDWCKWAMPASWLNAGRYDDGLEMQRLAYEAMLSIPTDRVRVSMHTEEFRAITRMRNNLAPFTDSEGFAYVSKAEWEKATDV